MGRQLHMLWAMMAGQRLRYAAAIAAILLFTLLSYLVPLVGQVTIDGAIAHAMSTEESPTAPPSSSNWLIDQLGGGEHLANNLWLAAVIMLALTLGAGAFTYLKGRWSSGASEGICRNVRDRLYDHLQRLPCSYHDKADTGDLVQRCSSDVETLRLFLSVQVVEIGNAIILLLTVVPIMLLLDVRMTLVSLVMVPIIITFAIVFFFKVKHRFKGVDEAEGKLTTVLQENLTGIRVVRAFARQDFERDKFAVHNAEYRNRAFSLIKLLAWYWTISDFLCLVQLSLALGMGAYWVAQGELTVGTLYAFLAYLHLFLWPVRQMGRTLTDLGKAIVALGRMREILDQPEESDAKRQVASDSLGGQPDILNQPNSGALSVQNLTFHHQDTGRVLNDVSFDVAAGETLGILGPSGSGKSTLIQLMVRLYDYETGTIELDGIDIRQQRRAEIRKQFGLVMQEPFLFAKSLAENIRHGHSPARDQEISAAAEAACIHDTIANFDQGYNTVLGERGVNLSGGQRQRVAIARALVGDPAILVFDDALSAVDSETEAMILNAIAGRKGKRTTIIIAHRLSAVMNADRILVLDHGNIVQRGTHETLKNEDGLYQRLWHIQSTIEQDLDESLV